MPDILSVPREISRRIELTPFSALEAVEKVAADKKLWRVQPIEAAREIGNQNAFDNLRESELIPGPNADAEEIGGLPDWPRRVLDTQLVPARWALISSRSSTQSFACTAFRVYGWRTPP